MMAARPPPMSPDRVERELREGVASGAIAFTKGADLDLVIGIYRRGFVAAIEEGPKALFYTYLGWGDEVVPTVVEAVEYFKAHRTRPDEAKFFNFNNNAFTDEGKRALKAAAGGEVVVMV